MAESTPDPPPATPPDPASPAAPAAPAAAPQRRGGRWKKVLLLSFLGLLLLLGALAALLPAILSSGFVRRTVEERASGGSGRRVSLGALSVGYGATDIRDLVVRCGPGEDSPVLARVGEVRVPAGISLAWAGRYDAGEVEVLRPEIRIDLRELAKPAPVAAKPAPEAGSGAARPGRAGEGGGERAAVPPFSVKVKVREGTLLVVGLDGRETRLGSFSADISASSDGPAEAALELDAGPGGKARVRVKASPFKDGRPVAAEALEAAVEAALEGFDLAPVRETAAALGKSGIEELKGVATGTLSARAGGDGSVREGKVVLDLRGLAVAGPALGKGVRVEEPEVRVEGGVDRGKDGSLELRDGLLRLKGLEARAGATLGASGAVNGALSATVSLEEGTARAKRSGVPFTGFLQGEVKLEARVATDPKGRRITGNAGFRDVEFAFGPGKETVEEPVGSAEFDVSGDGTAWTVSVASFKSETAELKASGTFREDGSEADLSVRAQVRLAPALRIARSFGVALPGEVAGLADLDARVRRSGKGGAGDRATGTLVVTDLRLRPPGEGGKEIREPRLEAGFDAVPGKDSIELKYATLKGAGADVRAAGTAGADGKSGTLSTCEASIDLEKAAALADALGAALPVRVSGTVAWKGPVNWKGGFAGADAAGSLVARNLSVTLPAAGATPERTLREEEVRVDLDAASQAGKDGKGFDTTLRKAALSLKGLDATASGSVSADGAVDLQVKGTLSIPEALRRAAEMKAVARDPGTRGTLDFDLGVKGKPGEYQAAVRTLEAKGAEFDLHASGALAEKGAGDLALDAGGDVATLVDLAVRAGLLQPVKDSAGTVKIRATATASGPGDPLKVTFDAGVEGLRWPDPSGGTPWTQKSVRATVAASLDRGARTVSGTAALKADDGSATVTGTADLAEGKRAVDAAADIDLDLGGFCRSRPDLLPLQDMAVGKAKGRVTLKGPLDTPLDLSKLQGSAKLALDSVRTKPFELKDAAVDLLLQAGTLTMQAATATVNGGAVRGQAALGLAGDSPKHFLEAHAEGVHIDSAMEYLLKEVVPLFAVGEKGGVTGKFRLDLRLDATGADWLAAKKTLHGKGSLAVVDGTVAGSGLLGDVLEFLDGGNGITFASVSTDFEVHDRRVWNDRLLVDGKEHSMIFKGSTTFAGDLDYVVGIKAGKGGGKLPGKLKSILDKDGNLVLKVRGTLSKPKVKL
jgi:hypothetical protein